MLSEKESPANLLTPFFQPPPQRLHPAPHPPYTVHALLPDWEKYLLMIFYSMSVLSQVSLLIKAIGPGDEGEYTCTALNPYGEVS